MKRSWWMEKRYTGAKMDPPSPRCGVCGTRIRGDCHNEGQHHKRNANVVTGAKLARKTIAQNAHGRPTNVGDPHYKR